METQLHAIDVDGRTVEVECTHVHALVLGSGAAGLNAAVQLHACGVQDILVVTEGLTKGTSINTGSDKQTYYKIGMYGADPDSMSSLAESFFQGGSMHGDVALVEAALSGRAFLNLVNLGVPFPRDRYGQYVGYKTDHDPRQRATSVGPYTSKEMCLALTREVRRRSIPVREGECAIALLTRDEGDRRRAYGAVTISTDASARVRAVMAENVAFAVGGPGGLYRTSVYPTVHTGAIGLALMEGARAQGLPESQYGMASIRFRWNVSGTYMQVVPRFISTDRDGTGNPAEFLRPYFDSPGHMNSMVFLKGYQWPFDPRKVVAGSSLIDLLVYRETVLNKRRVFLDFTRDPEGFCFDELSEEAREYLEKSGALLASPLERLQKMNPQAVSLYADNGIDIRTEPLEIAVCAQHNNGGLAANMWWESTNTAHLFPVGEVNGTHGVYRPGGSALNSGQVAGFRVAEYVANMYGTPTLDRTAGWAEAGARIRMLLAWAARCRTATRSWQDVRDELQARMTEAAAHIRSRVALALAVERAGALWKEANESGVGCASETEMHEAFTTRQLCFAHWVYLQAVQAAVDAGVGSRGSALVLDPAGTAAHGALGDEWNFLPEDPSFRDRVLETVAAEDGTATHEWVARRALPASEAWFETAWAAYREGRIYDA